tara:strand:- start:74 stop:907 length:834 start_codon:yes stop_codon:yes gene_type:complete
MTFMKMKVNMDDLQLSRKAMRVLRTEYRNVVSNTMERCSERSGEALKAQIARNFHQPKSRTKSGVFATKPTPWNLTAWVGLKGGGPNDGPFPQYGSVAWYLLPNIVGGAREDKRSEKRIARNVSALKGKHLVPTGSKALPLDKHGNVRGGGGKYTQVLSRLRFFNEAGYNANRVSSGKSALKRQQKDYFLASLGWGDGDLGIHARVGSKPKGNPGGIGRPVTSRLPRGYSTVFFITEQNKYKRRFPLHKIAGNTFRNNFKKEFPKQMQRKLFKFNAL